MKYTYSIDRRLTINVSDSSDYGIVTNSITSFNLLDRTSVTHTPATDGGWLVISNFYASATTLTHGTSASPAGLAHRTTREITIEDYAGHTLQSETQLYDGVGYETIAWRIHTLNDFGQTIATISSYGSHTTTAWGCCGPDAATAADGTVTEYAYDALQRPTLTTRVGHGSQPDLFTETTYDAAGRVTSAISYGGTSVSALTTNTYDLAGRLTRTASRSADGVDAVTLHTYDGLSTTTIRHGG